MQTVNSTPPNDSHARSSLAGKTVLIADDDPTLLQALDAHCCTLGLRVETASDGLRTLLAVTKGKPDLLILDLNLPDADGFRVVERLTDPKYPPLPVIVLTGRADDASIRRCEDLGVLYVHKGADAWTELQEKIQAVFEQKGLSRQRPRSLVGPSTVPRAFCSSMTTPSCSKHSSQVCRNTIWISSKRRAGCRAFGRC